LARGRAFAQLIWRAAVAIGACFAEPLVLHRGDLEPQDILRRLIAETGAISELSARFLPDDTGCELRCTARGPEGTVHADYRTSLARKEPVSSITAGLGDGSPGRPR
jgi:hypothetical protein